MKSPLAVISLGILVAALSSDANGQYRSRSVIVRSRPVYSTPVYTAPRTVHRSAPSHVVVTTPATDPLSVCDCGTTTTGPCNCKHLNCKITLPPCKTTGPTIKTPIKCDIYGTIPKRNRDIHCYDWDLDFQHKTEVPQIWCTIEKCVEIGKKTIQCVPGCSFQVCVPINDCEKKTVECKLVSQPMNMKIYRRNEGGRVSYDVYVINDPDPNSQYHAGGMPAKWLILHCATAAQVRSRLPNAKKADGSPLVKSSSKYVKPKATDADVDIKLIIEESLLNEYSEQIAIEEAEKSDDSQKPEPGKEKVAELINQDQSLAAKG